MKMRVAILAVLMAMSVTAAGSPTFTAYECVGVGQAAGFPPIKESTGESLFRIIEKGERVSVLKDGSDMCEEGATCISDVTVESISLAVVKVPGRLFDYSQEVRLDRKKLTFVAGGGGTDGGWSVSGTCKLFAQD